MSRLQSHLHADSFWNRDPVLVDSIVINKDFDLVFMESLASDPKWATRYSIAELAEKTGTQGVELVMWLPARATIKVAVRKVQGNYHVPISNAASGLLLLEAV